MTNDITIGARIRDLRQQKGMTQKELAGNHITRNMLSLIESGSSCPSVATLIYLAERLEVPVGYLFTNTPEEEQSYHKAAVITPLKEAYSSNNYEKCAEIFLSLPSVYADDEISMIAAVSCLKNAIAYAEENELTKAASSLAKAVDYSRQTMYLDHSFHCAIEYYAHLFRTLSSMDIPSILTDLAYASTFVPYEMVLYFKASKNARGVKNASSSYINGTFFERHIEAILLMNDEKWQDALKLLKELSTDSELPYFMRFKVLCDLETASDRGGDLRGAYVAARKKLEILESDN